MQLILTIQNRIYVIRGERVMLDKDLAALYEVETKVLNQAVKRNFRRFPADFMFQLTRQEWDQLQQQIAGIDVSAPSRSQLVTLNTARGKNLKYLPHAFTEQGVAMLSSVLHSEKAITMNIAIMRVFVELRKTLLLQPIERKAFYSKVINDHAAIKSEKQQYKGLPVVNEAATPDAINKKFLAIKQDAQDIVDAVLEQVLNDPMKTPVTRGN